MLNIETKIIEERYLQANATQSNQEFKSALALSLKFEQLYQENNWQNQKLSDVLQYLRLTHDLYRNHYIPRIEQQLLVLIKRGGLHGLIALKALDDFQIYCEHLKNHMEAEEEVFFPYAEAIFIGLPVSEYNSNNFKHEQNDEHLVLSDIRKTIASFAKNKKDLSVFSILNEQLVWFEKDLKLHAQIEDQVLIPMIERFEVARVG